MQLYVCTTYCYHAVVNLWLWQWKWEVQVEGWLRWLVWAWGISFNRDGFNSPKQNVRTMLKNVSAAKRNPRWQRQDIALYVTQMAIVSQTHLTPGLKRKNLTEGEQFMCWVWLFISISHHLSYSTDTHRHWSCPKVIYSFIVGVRVFDRVFVEGGR